jgi:signal transduction histidine kinase
MIDYLIRYLSEQSKLFLIGLSLVLILLLGGLDYLTGPKISVPIYYLIPVSLAAWFGGGWVGVWVSVISAIAGLTIDMSLSSSYSHPATPYWNTLARLGLFLIVTYILANLQATRRLREELQHFIVHDLGAPLGVIILALGALRNEAAALNSTQRMLAESAWASSQWMSTLINSLLNLLRLESEHMPLQISEVEPKELVELSLEQVALQAEQNQLILATELNTDIESLCADHELTVRVLVNLLGNAIKFSPPGSRSASGGQDWPAHSPGCPLERN